MIHKNKNLGQSKKLFRELYFQIGSYSIDPIIANNFGASESQYTVSRFLG
jgi:hypothetical protein